MTTPLERIARIEEQNESQERNIDDLYAKWDEATKCIRRIERSQWISMGQGAGTAVLLGFVLGKLFGVI
ncbi:MAG: hypothetical protein AB1753_04155 [Thermoproteota archaeon]